ncbi:biopolymer transporter ExbD [Flavobacterium sp.]|uniref:ExbD/TolR family protein n=1 Tax=Flavobacterium sp. TaxID=239 RepID=UPI0012029B6B|nr:biopolymer transporter ExbD [Flavobacterium sp.]RZJ69078.1 MAG: biopolymer transporter ExbD [Flavobacterium sp.]
MAELNTSQDSGAKAKKVRSKKLSSKVDLTAMVDLAFLLITFFMLTTSLSKPQSMDLTMPDNGPNQPMPVDENRTLTVLIDDNDRLKCFMGKLSENRPMEIASGTSAFRQKVLESKEKAQAYCESIGKKDQGLIVLIKPGKKSNYRNLVDALDEMAISDVRTFAIIDPDNEELKLLAMQ